VIGEIVAQLTRGESPSLDIGLLLPGRFAGRSG
jgi:hypothetical protein